MVFKRGFAEKFGLIFYRELYSGYYSYNPYILTAILVFNIHAEISIH